MIKRKASKSAHATKTARVLTDADHDSRVDLIRLVFGCVALDVEVSPEVALPYLRKVLASKRGEELMPCRRAKPCQVMDLIDE